MIKRSTGLAAVALGVCAAGARAATVPVPATCTAAVNAGLATFAQQHQGQEATQDNVLLCGTALRASYGQHAGHSGHGAHQILVLSVPTANGPIVVELVTNDALDGKVTANQGDAVFAFGQAFEDPQPLRTAGGALAAVGLHEPHCATHRGAEDGWVVVAGKRYPPGGCGGAR